MRAAVVSLAVLVLASAPSVSAQRPVTTASLLAELVDLDRLSRWPDPPYTTVQYSSTDRRTVAPDRPGWFANADGFGQEPIPGFDAVLRAPGADGVGEYLVCDVPGPGAIVRGWSAGMHGLLQVWLDDASAPLFAGKGHDFFAGRSRALLPDYDARPEDAQRFLQQQQADYLPIPFAQRLRITWTGRLRDLHFYQLDVRRYPAGTAVRSFAVPGADPEPVDDALRSIGGSGPWSWCKGMVPAIPSWRCELRPGETWHQDLAATDGAVLDWLRLQLDSAMDGVRVGAAAWRTTVLRVYCDDASVPQVETPVGDLSGGGPGLPRLHSLAADTRRGFDCLWPMPFARALRLELTNWGPDPVAWFVHARTAPRPFDDRSLYFHALWRQDRELHAAGDRAPIDLPYVSVSGRGRLVGMACQLLNPPMLPEWRSNWWGEGDEKIRADGVWWLGTGSEDYFNYSWSRWDRFDAPFCGQPLATGPGNCGFVSNHRLQVIDDVPFARELQVAMELWSHRDVAPLGYGRLAWFYAAPGAVTDHRALQPADVRPPTLPPWPAGAFVARGGSRSWRPGATDGAIGAAAGRVVRAVPCAVSRSGDVLLWRAPPDGELELPFRVADGDGGDHLLRLSCRQTTDGPDVQIACDGAVLQREQRAVFSLRCDSGERLEDLWFERVPLAAGPHVLQVRCAAGGDVGIDLVTVEKQPEPLRQLPGASDAELWDVLRQSPGVELAIQQRGPQWSAQHQRLVKARTAGDSVTFGLSAPAPGRYRVVLRLSTGPDYGVVAIDWNGTPAARDVDLFAGHAEPPGILELDLGARDLFAPAALTFTVTGHADGNAPPHVWFGVDCAVLEPR